MALSPALWPLPNAPLTGTMPLGHQVRERPSLSKVGLFLSGPERRTHPRARTGACLLVPGPHGGLSPGPRAHTGACLWSLSPHRGLSPGPGAHTGACLRTQGPHGGLSLVLEPAQGPVSGPRAHTGACLRSQSPHRGLSPVRLRGLSHPCCWEYSLDTRCEAGW